MQTALVAFLLMVVLFILGISFWVFARKMSEHTYEFQKFSELENSVYQISNILTSKVLTRDLINELQNITDPGYLIIAKYNGQVIAHGLYNSFNSKTNPNLLVNSERIQEMIQKAKNGGGYVEYEWIDPVTKKKFFKRTFVQPVVGKDYFVASGILRRFRPVLWEENLNRPQITNWT